MRDDKYRRGDRADRNLLCVDIKVALHGVGFKNSVAYRKCRISHDDADHNERTGKHIDICVKEL